MKKLICIFIAIFLIIGINPISAKNNEFQNEKNELLNYILEKVPEFNMQDGTLISITQYTDSFKQQANKSVPQGIKPLGAIGNSYMTVTIAIQRINIDQISYDSFKFTVVADWLSAPFFRFEDAIAVSWSDDFSQMSSSCKAYYNSIGYKNGKTSLIDAIPEEGICYSVDSSYYYGSALDYVTLVVNVRKPNTSDTASVCAKYGHSTYNILNGISVSFSSNNSITFSPSNAVDTMAKFIDFSY